MSTSGNLVDEFETSFQSCLAVLTNPSSTNVAIHDSDEVKTSVEQTIQKFLDSAKQMECFFLQKRFLLSAQKPEQFLAEDINELKTEIARKDQILHKYYDKLQTWQSILCDTGVQRVMVPNVGTPQTPPTPHPMVNAGPGGPLRQAGQHVMAMQGHLPQQQQNPVIQNQMMQIPPNSGPVIPHMNQGAHQMHQFIPTQPPQSNLQGPLAYLERTTSNIGMPDSRR